MRNTIHDNNREATWRVVQAEMRQRHLRLRGKSGSNSRRKAPYGWHRRRRAARKFYSKNPPPIGSHPSDLHGLRRQHTKPRFFEIFDDGHTQPHTSRIIHRRAAFFHTLKSRTGLMVARAAVHRTNINIEGRPLPTQKRRRTSDAITKT